MSTMIDIRRLQTVNELARAGATTVADNMSQLTGVETEMQITKINVIDVGDLGAHLGADKQVGVNVPSRNSPTAPCSCCSTTRARAASPAR